MQQISVISVPVTDQRRARDFYVEQVGFRVVAESSFGDGLLWIQLGLGGGSDITLVTWFDEMRPGSLRGLVIDCEDLQSDYEEMRERGVPFLGPPAAQAGGVFAMFTDPDGNRISLHQAAREEPGTM